MPTRRTPRTVVPIKGRADTTGRTMPVSTTGGPAGTTRRPSRARNLTAAGPVQEAPDPVAEVATITDGTGNVRSRQVRNAGRLAANLPADESGGFLPALRDAVDGPAGAVTAIDSAAARTKRAAKPKTTTIGHARITSTDVYNSRAGKSHQLLTIVAGDREVLIRFTPAGQKATVTDNPKAS